MVFGILASVASHETEVRTERQRAGIEAAREANGGKCAWGGRRVGTRINLTVEKEEQAKAMKASGKSIAEIGRVLGLTRQTIYKALGLWQRHVAT
jgi:DNA invertase Pin-like site-specific DNA recombinase